MKIISAIMAGVCLLSLTACIKMDSKTWIGGGGEYLKNEQGMVGDCRGNNISMENQQAQAVQFWQKNNLPKGTTNYMCKDGKAYLLNKVTDCQGKLIASQPGGIMKFRRDNGFPDGYSYVAFICSNGNVKPIMWE